MLVKLRYVLIMVLGCTTLLAPLAGAGDITSADEILKKLSGEDEAVRGPTLKTIRLRGITPVPAAAMAGSAAPKKKHAVDLTIHFETNSAQIAPELARQMLEIATALRQLDLTQTRLKIIGHTDSRGNADHNAELSRLRAQAVRDALADKHGISPDSLLAEGKGESRLLADPELSDADYARNRRVELELMTAGEL